MSERELNGAISISDTVHYVLRSYYSIAWLRTSALMSEHAHRVGSGADRPEPGEQMNMRSFVLACLTSSWAFLEAHINELFDDAHTYLGEPGHEALRGLQLEVQRRLADLWPAIKMRPTLDKYQKALRLAGVEPLPRESEPGQSADLLRRVRNHYLHYQPDSVRDGVAEGDDKRLTNALRGRIRLPAWDSGSDDLFPSRVLCPDAARWSVETAVRYTDAFCEQLAVQRIYDHVRPDWLTSPGGSTASPLA